MVVKGFRIKNQGNLKPINKEEALEFLKRVKHCLKGMAWSLNCGTLLGAIREKDFISHDLDVDVVLHDKHYDKMSEIVKCLNQQGCKAFLVTKFRSNFIQIYYKKCPGHIGCIKGKMWEEKFFKGKIKMVKIRGEDFPVPENAEELLTERYGDWKTPLSVEKWEELWKVRRIKFIKK